MAEIKDLTKDIVVAMLQSGALVPNKRQGVEEYNLSSINCVKTAYKEIFQTITDCNSNKTE